MRFERAVDWRLAAVVGLVVAGGIWGSVASGCQTRPASAPARAPGVSGGESLAEPASGRGGRPGPTAPGRAEIRRVVAQLNHPVPAKRRAAIRQLAEWGPLTFEALRQAAAGPDLEAALLARDLLAELESAILIGARVRIEVDRPRVNWEEPITLSVSAYNPTAAPIRVPWPKPRPAVATQPGHREAAQVGAMLDAADFLIVTGPDGERLDLRVEPIDRDRAVYEAVDVRARGTPPSHLVEPGETARLRVPQFNRGWARYPMLSAGTYTIGFAYQPRWKDESWTAEGFGRVRADPITVEVRQGARELLRRSARPLALRLSRTGDTLVARLESTWDVPQWINLNLGSELTMQARLEWRLSPVGGEVEPLVLGPDATLPVLRPDQIRQLGPGESMTIARMPVAALGQRVRSARVDPPTTWELSVRYVHIATPDQLREHLRSRDSKADVPTHIFSGSVDSEPLRLELGSEK